jgi:hypothetical protein
LGKQRQQWHNPCYQAALKAKKGIKRGRPGNFPAIPNKSLRLENMQTQTAPGWKPLNMPETSLNISKTIAQQLPLNIQQPLKTYENQVKTHWNLEFARCPGEFARCPGEFARCPGEFGEFERHPGEFERCPGQDSGKITPTPPDPPPMKFQWNFNEIFGNEISMKFSKNGRCLMKSLWFLLINHE